MARALLTLAAVIWLLALGHDGFDRWVRAADLPPLVPETSVEVRAADGSLLRAFTVADGRWRLEPGAVDPRFVAALVAYEDRRFYQHAGVDSRAVIRAGWQMLTRGRVVSGASTLTMQVARLLEGGTTGRWAGKLRQIRVALALERHLAKAEILNLYLRLAPYGGNIEGLRAATLIWFGKEPRRLTPAEAALMIALPQSPETRRPDRAPDAARAARARVLLRLAQAGLLTDQDAAAATRDPVPTARRPLPMLAPHLADRLRAGAPDQRRFDTTIESGLQAALERLAREAVAGQGGRLSIGIVVADHQTGAVRASVGAPTYENDARQGFVDMTEALRSPGSTLKPLIYGLAFDAGLAHPETLIEDRPVSFGTYRPQNFDGLFRGTVRLRTALQLSLNTPAVQLLDALGPAALMAALGRAGAHPVLPGGAPGLAVALGGVGMTLFDLVQLYAGIADAGHARHLHVLAGAASPPDPHRILPPEAAWQVGDILAGLAPPPGAPRNRLAYKTGTSYGHRDALAVGFDGRHVVGVWMGRADGTPVPGAFGGELAAPVLFEVFARLKPSLDPRAPPPPATLITSNAGLPPPLQRFRPRDALFGRDPAAPSIVFPPDGARVDRLDGGLMVRVDGGRAPFTWLADGLPVLREVRDRSSLIGSVGAGFTTLTVVDATGRAAHVVVQVQ